MKVVIDTNVFVKDRQKRRRKKPEEHTSGDQQSHAEQHGGGSFSGPRRMLAARLSQKRDPEGLHETSGREGPGQSQHGSAQREHQTQQAVGCAKAL